MVIIGTSLDGVHFVDLQRHEDERGFFARAWCRREFEAAGLDPRVVQVNLSFNHRKGTLRGLHCQVAPHEEAKMIRCVRGAIYDVVVDLRRGSVTYGSWLGVELNASNRRGLYVPGGFAHGFQTLEDDTEVLYHVSEYYTPGAERGIRWDDPRLAIEWPLPVTVISAKDRGWPDFAPEAGATPSSAGRSDGAAR